MDTSVISGVGALKINDLRTKIVVFFKPGEFIAILDATNGSLLK